MLPPRYTPRDTSLSLYLRIFVYIFGISVCTVLELCAYGSLSDVLRGDDGPLVKHPLSLSMADRMYLALGCAR